MQSLSNTPNVRRLAVAVAATLAAWPALSARAGASGQDAAQSSSLQDNTQRLNRYYEQERITPPGKPKNPLVEQPAPTPKATASTRENDEPRFVLSRVEFTPSALLDQAALQAAVAPFVGKPVSRADLARMLDAVNALYAERHITTARALLQTQNIVDGVVHVELVEGRLGKMRIEGARHLRESFVRRRIHLQPGEVVDSNRLRSDLVYLNRTSDIDVHTLLQPGAGRGQTDMLVQVDEPQRSSFDAFVDNSGVDSTGRTRAGVQAHLFGLARVDDRLDGNIAHSRGGNDGSLAYSLPVSASNGRIGVSYARSQIDIINDAFRDLNITGSSSVASVEYRQPLVATFHWLFGGIGSYSLTHSSTRINNQSIADTTNRSMTLGMNLDYQGDGRRWSVTQLMTRLRSGEPMLGRSSFTVAPGSAYYIQRFGHSRWALRADAGWQWSAGNNVPSANLFQIGGLGSVRGYQRGVLAGPRGYYLDLELHRSMSERLDMFAFADRGTTLGFYPQSKHLTGAGIGAVYRRGWLSVSGDVGRAFETVVPQQKHLRLDLRLAMHWN